jgi:hypothetical protein
MTHVVVTNGEDAILVFFYGLSQLSHLFHPIIITGHSGKMLQKFGVFQDFYRGKNIWFGISTGIHDFSR